MGDEQAARTPHHRLSSRNTYEITLKGRSIALVLNGQKTVDTQNGLFAEGPFALQHGAGVIKFRKVEIKEL